MGGFFFKEAVESGGRGGSLGGGGGGGDSYTMNMSDLQFLIFLHFMYVLSLFQNDWHWRFFKDSF